MGWFFQNIFRIKNLKTQWIYYSDGDKSHYVYIKDFDRFVFLKERIKATNGFVGAAYSVLVIKMC